MDTRKIQDQLARAFQTMGLGVVLNSSNQSESCYLSVYKTSAIGGGETSIRISNHKLPSHYTLAKFDLGSHPTGISSWVYVLKRVLEIFEVSPRGYVKGLITRYLNEKTRREAEIAESRRAANAMYTLEVKNRQLLLDTMEDLSHILPADHTFSTRYRTFKAAYGLKGRLRQRKNQQLKKMMKPVMVGLKNGLPLEELAELL